MKISHFGGAAKGHGAGIMVVSAESLGKQGKATFCEQKVAKKLYATGPQAQWRKVFAPFLIEAAWA